MARFLRSVRFFASRRLKYSRWTMVTLVADEGVESLVVRALVAHFAALGGVTLHDYRAAPTS